MYGLLLLLHVLAATIWTGGHIVMSVAILPRAIKERSPEQLLRFESVYEKIGMPALVVQIITGFILAYRLLPDFNQWLNFSNPITQVLATKIILLVLTFGLAINARFRILPNLSNDNIVLMAWHIAAVTVISILFVVAGVSFRTGWLY